MGEATGGQIKGKRKGAKWEKRGRKRGNDEKWADDAGPGQRLAPWSGSRGIEREKENKSIHPPQSRREGLESAAQVDTKGGWGVGWKVEMGKVEE